MLHLTIKHHDKGTVRHRRQLVYPEPNKLKVASIVKDGKSLKQLSITFLSVAVAVFRTGPEGTCSLWSRGTRVPMGLQRKAQLFGDCGLSPSLRGEAEGGSSVTGRPEVISCRWVGDSAAEASNSKPLDICSMWVRLTQWEAGRSGDRWVEVCQLIISYVCPVRLMYGLLD